VEASLLRERCMETELANEEWASKVEELEDERYAISYSIR
jgi:hypothetical protein